MGVLALIPGGGEGWLSANACVWSFQEDSDPPISESLSIENTLWAGTVIASGEAWPGRVAL